MIISEGFQPINDSSQNIEILAFALAAGNSICFCECLEDRPAFNLDAEGTFVGAKAINKWLSLVFFLRRGEILLQQCYNGGRVQELVRARAPPAMSHPSSSPQLPRSNSPYQTHFCSNRSIFKANKKFKADQYYKPNHYL